MLSRAHACAGRAAGQIAGLPVNAIATGRCTTLAVGPAGTVFSWGCGKLGRSGAADTPLPVPAFGANKTAGRAVFVVASEYTCAVITESGQVSAVRTAACGSDTAPIMHVVAMAMTIARE